MRLNINLGGYEHAGAPGNRGTTKHLPANEYFLRDLRIIVHYLISGLKKDVVENNLYIFFIHGYPRKQG